VAAGQVFRSVQQALSGKDVLWCCRSRTSNKAAESGLAWAGWLAGAVREVQGLRQDDTTRRNWAGNPRWKSSTRAVECREEG
jgi:hypothetical protein